MDTESRPSRKRAADVQTQYFEENEQLDADESAASLPQAEGESSDGRMFIGICEHVESETHNQRLGDKKLPEMDTRVSTKVWTSRQ